MVGLGRLLAEGQLEVLPELRQQANDPRWRVREGVAMALQRWGDADMGALVKAMQDWVNGTWLEQRAVAAGLCEPRLLAGTAHAKAVLKILDRVTRAVAKASPADRQGDDFKALRQGLAYCWSVAVAAAPAEGKAAMETWLASPDKDVLWIMRENLKKNRLTRMDANWVKRWETKEKEKKGLIFFVSPRASSALRGLRFYPTGKKSASNSFIKHAGEPPNSSTGRARPACTR